MPFISVTVVLSIVIAFLVVRGYLESRAWNKERQKMLLLLVAKNLGEFSQAERAAKKKPKPVEKKKNTLILDSKFRRPGLMGRNGG